MLEYPKQILEKVSVYTLGYVSKTLSDIGESMAIFYHSIFAPLFATKHGKRIFYENTIKQIYFTGVQALKPVIIISLTIGGIVIIQSINYLPKVGGEKLIGEILVVVLFREISPIVVSFIIIARSATAITTELAEMRVSGQFRNMIVCGINPNLYLFASRIWGMVFSMLALKIFFNTFSLLGGLVMARFISYINMYVVLMDFLKKLNFQDILLIQVKMFFLSLSISIVSIQEALKVNAASTEIPQAASRTVIKTIFYSLLLDILFSVIFYL